VLLRQTSFRALAEPRSFQEADGSVQQGTLRVRFGEVEARGVALTPAGRDRYDAMVAEVDQALADDPTADRQAVAQDVWRRRLPATESELAAADLAYFSYRVVDQPPPGAQPPRDLAAMAARGWVELEPIVYEDFLPRSAAGIFQSNLTSHGGKDSSQDSAPRDRAWLSEALDREVLDPMTLYDTQRRRSLQDVAARLGRSTVPRGSRA
jgi:uncharacterized glyoxalase superfamily metalloenzyme YdcJ